MAKKRSNTELTHLDAEGKARMVDVTAKPDTLRRAIAESCVRLSKKTLALLEKGNLPKGNALETARLAGIMAAKRTGELVPLCHVLPLDGVWVRFQFPDATTVAIEAEARATARTGVEMEALVAVSVAAYELDPV